MKKHHTKSRKLSNENEMSNDSSCNRKVTKYTKAQKTFKFQRNYHKIREET